MQTKSISKNLFDFDKVAFQNVFTTPSMIQDQARQLPGVLLENPPWIPGQGEGNTNGLVWAFMKARDDFKKAMDEQFEKWSNYFLLSRNKGQGHLCSGVNLGLYGD